MRYKQLLFIIVLFAMLSISYSVGDNQQAMYQNNPQYTGETNYTGPSDNSTKWINQVELNNYSYIDGSPVIDGEGAIFYPSATGNLFAYNPDGSLKWNFSTDYLYGDKVGIESTPALDNKGNIYFKTRYGLDPNSLNILFALDSNTGTQKWNRTFNEKFNPTNLIVDDEGNIFLTTYNTLFSFDSSGNQLWNYTITDFPIFQPISSPTMSDEQVFFVEGDGVLNSINKFTGEKLWEYDPNALFAIKSTPATIFNNTAYYLVNEIDYLDNGERISKLISVDLISHNLIKNITIPSVNIFSNPSISSEGNIYLSIVNYSDEENPTGNLMALDKDMNLIWNREFSKNLHASVTIDSEENIFFGSRNGFIYSYDKNGNMIWSYDLNNYTVSSEIFSSGAIDKEGTFYISSGNIGLFAFNIKPENNTTTNNTANNTINNTNNTTDNNATNNTINKPNTNTNKTFSENKFISAVDMEKTGLPLIFLLLISFLLLYRKNI